MATYVPLNYETFGAKAIKSGETYSFAAGRGIVPIVGLEFANVASCMPIAFFRESGQYAPVALMSFVPGRNLFVGPDGRWLGPYVPATFRTDPLRLLRLEGSIDQWALCIDSESPAVVEAGDVGIRLYDPSGEFSVAVKAMVELLTALEKSRVATMKAVAALAQAGLMCPWDIKLNTEHGESAVAGLYRVDEGALNSISAQAFLELRSVSALSLAYTQLTSMVQLRALQQLCSVQDRLRASKALQHEPSAPTFSITDQDSLHFG
ncbi:MAG: SapC family protein [Reyranellaceae bacterium]